MKSPMKWQMKSIIGRRQFIMRMFRKISETKNEVIYEYLCENYKLPYTGLVKIKKTPFCVSVEKTADGEWNEKKLYHVHIL